MSTMTFRMAAWCAAAFGMAVLGGTVAVGGTARATMAAPAVVAAPAPASPAVTCQPGLNKYDRTRFCFRLGVMVSVLRGRAAVGAVTFDLTHSFQLSARSADFTERITISDVRVAGAGAGVRLGLAVSCPRPCAATSHFTQGRLISQAAGGVIDYRDGVRNGAADVAASQYVLSFTRPGDKPGGYSYRAPISYRCDDELPGVPAGCVFPAYVPYFTAMRGLAGVIGNIRAAQRGPAHEGRPGSGHPLSRITSPARQAANYKAVCARPAAGSPPRRGEVCDEYPFRSTSAGGTTVVKADRHVAWVPAAQETAKNKALATFYLANRVLCGDRFWVVP
jgi:Deoxyribonuclease NucA/NucB